MNKYALKELALIRIIAEKGRIQDARLAGSKWVDKAGACETDRQARIRALAPLLARFDTYPKGQAKNGS